ncbi:hypothetical protein C8J56DRAFT_890734 [Mycena floridula]|nr:hypothetical protein C8J56DRAFT_890734 [Mycena floridula]
MALAKSEKKLIIHVHSLHESTDPPLEDSRKGYCLVALQGTLSDVYTATAPEAVANQVEFQKGKVQKKWVKDLPLKPKRQKKNEFKSDDEEEDEESKDKDEDND